jgi:hypothetical protein
MTRLQDHRFAAGIDTINVANFFFLAPILGISGRSPRRFVADFVAKVIGGRSEEQFCHLDAIRYGGGR